MTLIAHISDTHFGTEMPIVLKALQEKLEELRPDITVLSGDITQRATIAQFAAAKSFFDKLPGKRKLVVPGNHDIPLYNLLLRFFDPYSHYMTSFSQRETVIETPEVVIIGLDATTPYRHTRGELSIEDTVRKISYVKSNLSPKTLLGACIHQPIIVSRPEDKENLLVDATTFVKIFSENRVDFILSGHIHYPLLTTTKEMVLDLPYHFVFSGAGTAVSSRIRLPAPNSFNTLSLSEGKKISAARWDFEETSEQFFQKQQVDYQRTEKGWL